MPAKKLSLAEQLNAEKKQQDTEGQNIGSKLESSPEKSKPAPSRMGKKVLSVHLPVNVVKQYRMLCLEQDTSSEKMMAEALNLLFVKHGKPDIA